MNQTETQARIEIASGMTSYFMQMNYENLMFFLSKTFMCKKF